MALKAFAVCLLLLCAAIPSSADDFNFTYTGNFGDTVSGTLVTTSLGGGQFQITSILNGFVDGAPIVGVIPPGTMGNNDNLLFIPQNPNYLDFNGLAFFDQFGDPYTLNYSGGYDLFSATQILDFGGLFTVQPAGNPVPEPTSILLLATGLLGILEARHRK